MSFPKFKPCLSNENEIFALPRRMPPYWQTLRYCRHIGVQRHPFKGDYWVARVRLKAAGQYRQQRLGKVDFRDLDGLSFERALVLAENWFQEPEIAGVASPSFPIGTNRQLKYDKSEQGFTVGDALRDYVEWKRVAAAKTTFESILSLINFHIIPRLGNILVADLDARKLTKFIVDVLETPPKHGRRSLRLRFRLEDLTGEQLRKRKKTVNTLLGILKLSLEMAWENGEFNEERIWRTIRRLPHKDAPRNIFLSRAQCRELLTHCQGDLSLVVQGALYTGCRITELSNLLVSDVAPGIQGIYVAPSKSYKGRYVFLPNEGLSFFLEQCAGKEAEEPVFQMKSGRRWNGNHKHLFKAAVRASGLPEKFVFHGLRHTYASQLVQSGTPLAIVARQLGHATTDTVSRTYGHLTCESIEKEIQRRFLPLRLGSNDVEALIEKPNPKNDKKIPTDDIRNSWPSSNFSRAGGELVLALRGR